MNALTIFIRRPVLASMITILLLVLGVFSYRMLGVDLMPKVDIPVVIIRTMLRGASPEEVESQVTKPIEEAVNTVTGIDELSSYSVEGLSTVVVKFVLERPLADAVQDVRDKVAAAQYLLPPEVEPPVVSKFDIDSQPVMSLAISGPRDMKELSEITRLRVKEAIENVDGVGSVTPVGSWNRAINVFLDLDRLQAYGIPIAQVKGALAAQNVEIPSGRIDRDSSEQVLRTLARVERVEDFLKIVVATRNGRQITIGDIGRAEDSIEEPRTLARIWHKGDQNKGQPAVTLNVVRQSGTNTVEVIKKVKQRLEQVKATLPPDIQINIVSDQSVFILRSIHELNLHLVLGAILASLAVLFFMRNLRSTIIAAVAIPASLVSTFTFMRALGFTLNNMSLLGLTLAVGIVIDDSIVVLENIFRHLDELGKNPIRAAMDGLLEIGLAVMATTTSLIVIFLPVAFMQGMAGRFFYEFGLTVAFAIGVSLIISFTLTPMLSSRFLKIKPEKAHQDTLGWAGRAYNAMLVWVLNHRWITIAIAVLIVLSTGLLAKILGKDFMPQDDRSEFQVNLIVPAGSSLSTVDQIFGRIEERIQRVDGVLLTMTQIGSTTGAEDVTKGSIYVSIVDIADRKYTQFDKMKEVRAILAQYPEIRSSVSYIGGFGGGRNFTFSYNLMGPDLAALMKYSDQIAARLRGIKGFVDVDTSLASRQPEVRLELNRQKAADLGLTAADIANTMRTMVGGDKVTKFREGVEQYDVWLRLDKKDRNDAEIIARLPLASSKAGIVPLSQVANLSEGLGPTEIDRYNRQRVVQIYSNLDHLDLGSASNELQKVIAELKLPVAYTGAFTGQSKMMGETITNMMLAFVLAFIFMYIVLAAQFESFLHPVTILLALPLTVPFALLSLFFLRESINMYSLLGVFMLFGIVKKNGILQIDYTNTLLARGKALREAIMEANHARLRPILMTTITLIAGMTPIALGQGPGAAARASMAKVIIGGQAMSLVITLAIVPVAFSLFEGVKARAGIKTKEKAAHETAPNG
ncbi:MAG: efflux RND transporter permease subunit [Myxococcales bacterium]|nr:efflux RND transporter permease subunit [Myxococcales bacterium]